MFQRSLAISSSVLYAALSLAQSPSHPDKPGHPAHSPDFAKLRQRWVDNLRQKRIDRCVAEYTSDGEFLQPDGSRVTGAAAIRDLYRTITTTFDSNLVFTPARVEVSGGLAYDSGTYREALTVRASGKHMEATGSYLTLYRRAPNGDWLIAQQMWSGSTKDE
jgi:ketosteroid isomerase-like protein